MTLDVQVLIGIFGERGKWWPLAERAAISAQEAGAPSVRIYHAATLHDARNTAASFSEAEWLCFLDADDALEPGYFDAMETIDTDLRAPLVRYVRPGMQHAERVRAAIPAGTDNMRDGNRLVIGTLIRRSMFTDVGGFRDWPFYEDWDLWQRCWLAGATIGFCDAVYRAHVRRDSRNRAPSRSEKERVHHAIRRGNLPHLYDNEGIAIG